jgi:hypothetical protein
MSSGGERWRGSRERGIVTAEPLPTAEAGAATLGVLLAEAAHLTPEARTRLLALEEGRHPPLEGLRTALGPELDVDTPLGAARIALGGPDPDDAHLAAGLDSAYRALTSPRIVRGTITADRIAGARDGGPIRTREHEPLMLLVLADNRTDASVEFSAESHGEGFGGVVEAGRTGSSLLDLGTMPAGSYLVPLLLVANGRPTTVDLPIECSP